MQEIKTIRNTPRLIETEKEGYCLKNETMLSAQKRREELVDPKVTKTARRHFVNADKDRVAVKEILEDDEDVNTSSGSDDLADEEHNPTCRYKASDYVSSPASV